MPHYPPPKVTHFPEVIVKMSDLEGTTMQWLKARRVLLGSLLMSILCTEQHREWKLRHWH